MAARARIGVDLGGTKIAITALGDADAELFARRRPTPRGDYEASLALIADLVAEAEQHLDCAGLASVGVAMPGSLSPVSGRVQNANSTWLNGRALDADLAGVLGRPVRFANDANCLALSEAADGAGKGARSVFGVIIGTGCGGGLVYRGRLIDGPRGNAGEWGHNPLPWAEPSEIPGPECWCGLRGCMETWISGPALHRDFLAGGGDAARAATGEDIAARADEGDAVANAALARHASRVARGLAMVVNIFDPEVIVLGGGLSRLAHLYTDLPPLMRPFIFADDRDVAIRPPKHGDASGGRGAARLWDAD
ncbi:MULTISPECIES: ROK family protein [Rhodomicrobium]|uniref:ROK family protein n=1 Tax=Rhodomicrobium TaxID=1068 RepID=UPI000B4BB9CC|nr:MULTISPECIES: ROK family protein [Rhodomicrobium]